MTETVTGLEKIKFIDPRTKDIVNGYLRRLRKLIEYDENLKIPRLISYCCLLFFYVGDSFKKSADIQVNETGTIATTIGSESIMDYKTIYGTNEIGNRYFTECKCIWRIKMIKESSFGAMVGIGSDCNDNHNHNDTKSSSFDYYMDENGFIKSGSGPYQYGKGFKLGEIVHIILDVGKKTLTFQINDDEDTKSELKNIPFDNKSYHLVIEGSSVAFQLLEFQVHSSQ